LKSTALPTTFRPSTTPQELLVVLVALLVVPDLAQAALLPAVWVVEAKAKVGVHRTLVRLPTSQILLI
jgi:hypothetical protein